MDAQYTLENRPLKTRTPYRQEFDYVRINRSVIIGNLIQNNGHQIMVYILATQLIEKSFANKWATMRRRETKSAQHKILRYLIFVNE